ncbi:hypothetical protein CISIN_1g0452641mg, partial [Citrus sinensis]
VTVSRELRADCAQKYEGSIGTQHHVN